MIEFLLFGKLAFAILSIIMSFLLLVKSKKMRVESVETKLNHILTWVGRCGLAIILFSSFSHLIDLFMEMKYDSLRDLAMLTGFVLYSAKTAFNTIIDTSDHKEVVRHKSKPIIFGYGAGYLAVMAAIVTFFWAGPALEQKYFPVLINVHYANIVRSPTTVCWTSSFEKVRQAKIEYIYYIMKEKDKAYNISVSRLGGVSPNVVIDRGLGLHTQTLCASIPDEVRNDKGLLIRGEAKYITNSIWPFFYKTGPIMVPDEITD